MAKTATWVGDEDWESWSGVDADGTIVTLAPGEPIEVSDALAERLANDHPGLVEIDGVSAAQPKRTRRSKSASKAAPPADPPAPAEEE